MTKNLILRSLALVLFMASSAAYAQYTTLNGVTVHARSMLYVSNGEVKTETISQIYNCSFKDNILVHNIIEDGIVSNSQIYKLKNVKIYMDGENTIFKMDALSGVSGFTYKYKISVDKDGKLISLLLTNTDDSKTTYTGGITVLKTYEQD